MKHHHQYHHDHNQHPVNPPKQPGSGFSPSAADVAKRAYAIYEHQGSQSGHDVQDWLEAEGQLTQEHQQSQSKQAKH